MGRLDAFVELNKLDLTPRLTYSVESKNGMETCRVEVELLGDPCAYTGMLPDSSALHTDARAARIIS
jgi:hypothetical protein